MADLAKEEPKAEDAPAPAAEDDKKEDKGSEEKADDAGAAGADGSGKEHEKQEGEADLEKKSDDNDGGEKKEDAVGESKDGRASEKGSKDSASKEKKKKKDKKKDSARSDKDGEKKKKKKSDSKEESGTERSARSSTPSKKGSKDRSGSGSSRGGEKKKSSRKDKSSPSKDEPSSSRGDKKKKEDDDEKSVKSEDVDKTEDDANKASSSDMEQLSELASQVGKEEGSNKDDEFPQAPPSEAFGSDAYGTATATILRTLQEANQTLKESLEHVEDPMARRELIGKQNLLRKQADEILTIAKSQSKQSGISDGFNVMYPLSSQDYHNRDLGDIVASMEEFNDRSPLMKQAAILGPQSADLQNLEDFVGPFDDDDSSEMHFGRPLSASSSQVARDVEFVKGVREKIQMAAEGKDIFYDPVRPPAYDIADAERDVVDLRRMRRQLRCLFGPSGGMSDMRSMNYSQPVGGSQRQSPMGSLGLPGSMMSTQLFANSSGAGDDLSPKSEEGAPPPVHSSGNRYVMQGANQYDPPSLVEEPPINFSSGPSNGGLNPRRSFEHLIRHAGANWAEEVVRASAQPGNQWQLGCISSDGASEAAHSSKNNVPASFGGPQGGQQHKNPPPQWLKGASAVINTVSNRLRNPENSKTLDLGGGRLFRGELKDHVPDGLGVLYLADGSQHIGTFRQGRASGEAVFLSQRGCVLAGTWKDNKRSGLFHMLDTSGSCFEERYEHGSRVSRLRTLPANGQDFGCEVCTRCGLRFCKEFNHAHACKRNDGNGEWIFRYHEGFM